MKITLDLKKSVNENAADYFDKSKKISKKIEGAKKAVDKAKEKLAKLEKKEKKKLQLQSISEEKKILKSEKKWYHKFRWFYTSDNFLVIGGRDVTTNEIVIKKYTDKDDLVFHTEMPASPFVVLKADKKKISKEAIEEAAQFTSIFSSAWNRGIASSEVFYVNPEQVTKKAQSGEYLSKGAFMIYGKKSFVKTILNLATGIYEDNSVMTGPISAIKKHCTSFVEITQGNDKLSDLAKKIQRKINADLDEIIRNIPPKSALK